jgi:photosystem II protein PsbQ
MKPYKSILASLLAVVMVFLVSCGSPTPTKPPTYTPETLEQISSYESELLAFRDRMIELEELINKPDWVDVSNLIHGPLGDLRRDMSYASRLLLLPKEQKNALAQAREVFRHLETIDLAAQEQNYLLAEENYAKALKDFDEFLSLLPTS